MQTVLILGAMSDIGRALARQYAAAGWRLQLAARQAGRLDPDAQDLRIRYQAEVQALEFDARSTASHAAWYAALDPAPDLVICVFGLLGRQARAQQHGPEALEILETNYTGAVSILERAAEAMEQRGSGCIAGISSVAGDRGRASNYLYGSAKAGFTAYLSGIRNRLASKGVHVLTVKPGFVRTAMTEGLPLPPLLTASPGEVAQAIARAVERRRNVIYVRWMWRWIMLVIRHLPEGVFKRMKL
jgi:short-subunit dehydrogenase